MSAPVLKDVLGMVTIWNDTKLSFTSLCCYSKIYFEKQLINDQMWCTFILKKMLFSLLVIWKNAGDVARFSKPGRFSAGQPAAHAHMNSCTWQSESGHLPCLPLAFLPVNVNRSLLMFLHPLPSQWLRPHHFFVV